MAEYLISILGEKLLKAPLDLPTSGELPSPNVRTLITISPSCKTCCRGLCQLKWALRKAGLVCNVGPAGEDRETFSEELSMSLVPAPTMD